MLDGISRMTKAKRNRCALLVASAESGTKITAARNEEKASKVRPAAAMPWCRTDTGAGVANSPMSSGDDEWGAVIIRVWQTSDSRDADQLLSRSEVTNGLRDVGDQIGGELGKHRQREHLSGVPLSDREISCPVAKVTIGGL